MLQAVATLVFLAVALVAGGMIGKMLAEEWSSIRRALGGNVAVSPQPLPPRYRTLPARRATMLTLREDQGLRAAA